MKILVIAQRFPPDRTGSSTRSWNVVKGLEKLGHEIVLVTAFPRDFKSTQLKNNKAFVHEQNNKNLFRVWIPALSYTGFGERLLLYMSFIFSSLFPMFSIHDIDVVWAANPNFFSMFPAIIYSLIYRAPIVRNVDDLWPEAVYDFGYIKSPLLKKLINFMSKITYVVPKAITPISKSYKTDLVRRYRIDEQKIFVIAHGVDVSILYPDVPKNNFYKGNFIVMYSGNIGISYDFNIILNAAKMLSEFDDIKFVIRGLGEQIDVVKNKIKKYNLSNVILDTAFVDKSQLRDILNSANVFVIPMKALKAAEQGLPTKILEYQACGKPIICCSSGESSNYINFTKSGLVVKPGDAKALVSAVLKLYHDKQLRENLGANGWNNISQNVTIQKIGEKMHSVFSKVTKLETKC